MPRTPDRHPGPLEEDQIRITRPEGYGDSYGTLEYGQDGYFSFTDAYGAFNPRTGDGISAYDHKRLRHLIHFIDDGPAGGFASGAYREVLPAGSPFPTSYTWYESSAKAKKIVELTVTYTGAFPTTEVWKMYDDDGATVLVTVTDTIAYSGGFETNRTRAIS